MDDLLLQFDLFQEIDYLIKRAVAIEWKRQGHDLTGEAIKNINGVIARIAGGERIDYYILDYMAELNEGVPASKIPKKGTAEWKGMIKDLTGYAKKRMDKGDKEAQSIAYAIGNKWLVEGKPTKASARFSSTGKRTGFIEAALEGVEPELAQLIERGVEESINFVLESYFKTQIGR